MKKNAKKAIGGMSYIDEVVLPCVGSLHRCSDQYCFLKLAKATLQRFRDDGENEFASYFAEYYLCDKWMNWYAGSQPIAGVGFTNNPHESGNKMIKVEVII